MSALFTANGALNVGDAESPHFFGKGGERKSVPKHVAIIMDGNGRWAQKHGWERFRGHVEGMKRIGEVINVAIELHINVLTLYTFSKQNWKRPQAEVAMLMKMICMGLEQKVGELIAKNVRFDFIGQREGIPDHVLNSLKKTKELTTGCTGLNVNLAFNYDGRSEILDAIKGVVRGVLAGDLNIDDINEEVFSRALYTKNFPDPDLLIRTSGEKRISNFLLWQIAYTELYFADVFWPDFTGEEFRKAIDDFHHRERRFGDIKATS